MQGLDWKLSLHDINETNPVNIVGRVETAENSQVVNCVAWDFLWDPFPISADMASLILS